LNLYRAALVTGANRGIGFEACRQLARTGLRVVLTARDAAKGRAAAEALRNEGLEVSFEELDVTDGGSVGACARRLSDVGANIDALVNNAGVNPTEGILELSEEAFRGRWRSTRWVPSVSARRSYRGWSSAATAAWSAYFRAGAPSARAWVPPFTPSPRPRSTP
jgi:NAD(P)-dependent dehydrogenase (short-subunit alcohol dehydrogenase family)